MITYKYEGVSKDGMNVNGVLSAYDEFEAVASLREKLSIVTNIEPVAEKKGIELFGSGKIKVKAKDLAIMCSQFSIILQAGLPIVRSVEMVADQVTDKALKEKMKKVAEDIGGGFTMAQSFETNLPDLPTTFIETIRAGEASGSLETCFKRLATYYDRSSKIKAKVAGALTYPAIVIVVAIAVMIIIMTVAVPLFTSTFADLGTELPGITKGLIAVSNFFVKDWWIIIIAIAALAGIYLLVSRNESGKRFLSEFALMKSPVAKIKSMSCASDFASTMSTMLAAGLPLVRALEITASVISNYVFSLAIFQVKEDVEQGKGLADSMRQQKCIPVLLTEMCGVGEKTGSMEATLDVIGDFYSSETQLATDKLLAAMEPAITVGLAVITCVLLLAVYMPMFSMYDNMAM